MYIFVIQRTFNMFSTLWWHIIVHSTAAQHNTALYFSQTPVVLIDVLNVFYCTHYFF